MKEFICSLFFAVVTAAVPVLAKYAIDYIKQAKERALASTDDIKKQGYIKEIADAITDAVAATSQTYVDALKKAGTFTEEAQAEAAQKALTACLTAISPPAKAFAETAYGDLTVYLANKIEAEVRKQKRNEPVLIGEVSEVRESIDTTTLAATTAAASAAAAAAVVKQTLPEAVSSPPNITAAQAPAE